MPDRLTVGQMVLDHLILVRIEVGQQRIQRGDRILRKSPCFPSKVQPIYKYDNKLKLKVQYMIPAFCIHTLTKERFIVLSLIKKSLIL